MTKRRSSLPQQVSATGRSFLGDLAADGRLGAIRLALAKKTYKLRDLH